MRLNILKKLPCLAALLSIALCGNIVAEQTAPTETTATNPATQTKLRVSIIGGSAIPVGQPSVARDSLPGSLLGGQIFAPIAPKWGLGLTYDYFDITNEAVSGSNYRSQMVTLSGMYSLHPQKKWTPFVQAGVGPGQSRLNGKFNQISLRSSVGVEYFLDDHLSIGASVGYYFVQRASRRERDLHILAPSVMVSYSFGRPKSVDDEKPVEQPVKKEEKVEVVPVSDEGCPQVGSDQKVELELKVFFDLNKAVVKPSFGPQLDKVGLFLKKCTQASAEIDGHTDTTGTEKYNQALSEKRAENVRQIFIKSYGIDPARLNSKGFGYKQPEADNSSLSGRKKNRRASASYTVK